MKIKALGDVINITSGFAFKASLFNNLGKGLPLIRCRDVNTGLSGTYYEGSYDEQFLVQNGDILVSMDGDFRAIRWPHGPALLNQRVCRLKSYEDLCPAYLSHFLPVELEKIHSKTSYATVKHLSAKSIREIPIALPSIDEQKRIAAILDKADAIRRKRANALELADEFLKSAFLDMFGDPVTNPKGWPQKSLDKLLSFLTSGSRGWAKYYSEEGRLFLRIQNVGKNQLLLDDVAYVSAPDTAEARRTLVQEGDVLLSITADLGRTAVIPPDIPTAHINQHLALLRPRGIQSLYLSAFLSSHGGQRQIQALNKNGVKAGLNFTDVRSLQILLPPEKMQEKFKRIYNKYIQTLDRIYATQDCQDNLFNSLAQRAFCGELSAQSFPGTEEEIEPVNETPKGQLTLF